VTVCCCRHKTLHLTGSPQARRRRGSANARRAWCCRAAPLQARHTCTARRTFVAICGKRGRPLLHVCMPSLSPRCCRGMPLKTLHSWTHLYNIVCADRSAFPQRFLRHRPPPNARYADERVRVRCCRSSSTMALPRGAYVYALDACSGYTRRRSFTREHLPRITGIRRCGDVVRTGGDTAVAALSSNLTAKFLDIAGLPVQDSRLVSYLLGQDCPALHTLTLLPHHHTLPLPSLLWDTHTLPTHLYTHLLHTITLPIVPRTSPACLTTLSTLPHTLFSHPTDADAARMTPRTRTHHAICCIYLPHQLTCALTSLHPRTYRFASSSHLLYIVP